MVPEPPKNVAWKASAYAITSSYQAVNSARCTSAEELRWAVKLLDSLDAPLADAVKVMQTLPGGPVEVRSKEFRAALARISKPLVSVDADVRALRWLREKLAELPESGTFAATRLAALDSLDAAIGGV